MYPRLDHFIVRPDMDDGTRGPIVPLIAVDQLPNWIQLTGVPRELDAEHTIAMINLGIVGKEDYSVFEVCLEHDKIRAILNDKTESHSLGNGKGKGKTTKTKTPALPTQTKGKSVEKAASENTSFTFVDSPSAIEPGPLEKQQPRMLSASRHNAANAAVGTQAPKNSEKPIRPHMIEATHDEPRPAGPKHTTNNNKQDKQICRFWCHNGWCKYGDRCWHLHRMPATVEGLHEVGLKAFPRWCLVKMSGGAGPGTRTGRPGLLSMDATPSGPGDAQSPTQQQKQQPPPLHHLIQLDVPDRPSEDLRQLQDHMSAPLASGGAVSSRQKPKPKQHSPLRGAQAIAPQTQNQTQGQQQQPHPHSNKNNYANLSTNASVAANAASHRQQAERQQLLRNDMPVVTRVKAREGVNDNRSQGTVVGRAVVGEANLLDGHLLIS